MRVGTTSSQREFCLILLKQLAGFLAMSVQLNQRFGNLKIWSHQMPHISYNNVLRPDALSPHFSQVIKTLTLQIRNGVPFN